MKLITTMLERNDYLITLVGPQSWDIVFYRMMLYSRSSRSDAYLYKGLKI